METTGKTVLVTGGGSGIGLAIARHFSENGNRVIIVGRNADKLRRAAAQLKNVTPIVCDITNTVAVAELVATIKAEYPELSILINNAGQAFVYNLAGNEGAATKAKQEMYTNFFSILELVEGLLPVLEKQPAAAIVNVSSIVSFAPSHKLATYAASKAALHSYTQSLRIALEDSPVKVFELMPPLVDTELSKEIGGAINGIPAAEVAEALLAAMHHDEYEIHVGRTAALYELFRASPAQALEVMNPKMVPVS